MLSLNCKASQGLAWGAMAGVFISYSKKDRVIAEALADDLKAQGVDVWWDFELYAGENFHDAILAALDAAKTVIVIWSDSAVSKERCFS